MTAIAIKRLSSTHTSSIESVGLYLLEKGVGFLFGAPRNRLATPFHDVRVCGLGRRWRGYCPDEADYASYRQKCHEVLSIDRVRRALRCGGILWRIAMEHLDANDGIDAPSREAMNEPLWIYNRTTKRPELVEDGLSIDEVRLLIGSYEIKDSIKDKSVFCSYWPPPWIWENSGFFVGYWTPDCEDWFVNTQRKYENGGLALANIEEWKARLKRFGDTKKLRHAIERQCESILTRASS
ncbi:hypothetical protein SCHPADRAFT_831864 [Schizopora paradoxa]|uniref:Uncharacterized protein n=1 Tax=Schizopora paradoxa TaxID=27342 RepID=A0A0H2S1S1_9AGAM|nr:hypothetical protein SCHPADRAFT_831864 [Schizopora paradoxa]